MYTLYIYIQIKPIIVVFRKHASGRLTHAAVEDDIGYDLARTPLIEVIAYILSHKALVFVRSL